MHLMDQQQSKWKYCKHNLVYIYTSKQWIEITKAVYLPIHPGWHPGYPPITPSTSRVLYTAPASNTGIIPDKTRSIIHQSYTAKERHSELPPVAALNCSPLQRKVASLKSCFKTRYCMGPIFKHFLFVLLWRMFKLQEDTYTGKSKQTEQFTCNLSVYIVFLLAVVFTDHSIEITFFIYNDIGIHVF